MQTLRHVMATVFAGLLLSSQALAQCTDPDPALGLTELDIERLQGLEESRRTGLEAAEGGEIASERAVIEALYADALQPVEPEEVEGRYQCRTIKMGGLVPLVVYGWFRCSITPEEQAFTVTKLTGSQNFTGTLFPQEDGSYLYRGAGHYADEAQRAYGDDSERDQVGCFWAVEGERHFILELPSPQFESEHDVIEFRPA